MKNLIIRHSVMHLYVMYNDEGGLAFSTLEHAHRYTSNTQVKRVRKELQTKGRTNLEVIDVSKRKVSV